MLAGPLVVENVSLTLPGSADSLLKSVSLRLEPGECLGIIGLSGSGKSLLGRLISGTTKPTQGHVTLGSAEVAALQGGCGARHLGYMPQEIDLIGTSVADIIGRLGEAGLDDVIRAAKLVGLHETIMRLPNAYNSDVADGNSVLLRGHQQRLGLARALCGNPRLVVLDEPNASLDYLGEQMLLDVVQTMKANNTTIIVITHRMGILTATDKIAIMQGGALSAFGSRDEIFARYIGRPHSGVSEHVPARITPRSAPECEQMPNAKIRTGGSPGRNVRSRRNYTVSNLHDNPADTPFSRMRGIAWAGNVLVFGYVLGVGTWSLFAPLESAAVASGLVEAKSSRKTLQHLEGEIVRAILVKDGDIVAPGQPLIRLDSTKSRSERQSLHGQFWDAKAREARLLAERAGADQVTYPDEFSAALADDPSLATIFTGHQDILQTRAQVLRSHIQVIREKMAQVDKEIIGLKAQELAAAKRAEIARQETAAVQTLVEKGLERRPRLLALERETAEIDGRRGELAAQVSRAFQVISESQAMLLKLETDRQNEIAQSLRETQGQILV